MILTKTMKCVYDEPCGCGGVMEHDEFAPNNSRVIHGAKEYYHHCSRGGCSKTVWLGKKFPIIDEVVIND